MELILRWSPLAILATMAVLLIVAPPFAWVLFFGFLAMAMLSGRQER